MSSYIDQASAALGSANATLKDVVTDHSTPPEMALATLIGLAILFVTSRRTPTCNVGSAYFLAKVLVLCIFYAYLDYFGLLTLDFKFKSFLVVTPIIKFFHFYHNKISPSLYMYSLFNDSFVAYLQFKVIIPNLVGNSFALYPIVDFSLKIIMEKIQHVSSKSY